MILVFVNFEGCAEDVNAHSFLSGARLEKFRRVVTGEGKIQNLCAEAACLLAVHFSGQKIQRDMYEYRENGKPFLRDGFNGYISIAHAGLSGACAWSHEPVGMDFERADRNVIAVKRRILSPEEAEAPDEALLAKWCVKESYVKLTGEGLSRSFTGITAKNGFVKDDGGGEARYRTGTANGHIWALSSLGDDTKVNVISLTFQEALEKIAMALE
ncbi:MAG: 4'-phosphopantetheinyl transferase superfamily protein [Clostridia bacterium]|nr:4'-phosphopantetheinyl transferase superfamily protein [Clostridia bacterium]